ncbi:MAG TPA: MG2 domain-containing protein [Verrucomicrobiae bacterium]|nr:MG2 domain-containing protein [Verrucomicrobiae bacterium]
MRLRNALLPAACLAFHLAGAQPDRYQELKSQAEKLYAGKSFALAHEAYTKALTTNLSPAQVRWVKFRLADTEWRSQAATKTADTTKLDEARHQLEVLVRDITRVEDHDRVWAEVEESLGDYHWVRRDEHNWGAAWPCYQAALDWWAGAPDINLARQRYLDIVWRLAKPPGVETYYSYGSWGNYVPLDVLDNALKIAQTQNDKAHAHYLVAMTLRNQGGDWDQRARVPDEFQAAVKLGKGTDWYDDALYNYGEWMLNRGRVVWNEDGSVLQQPDYVKALELFRRLVAEFQKGQTRCWDQAQNQIHNITDPQVGLSVQNVFLPDSEVQYFLTWRNLKRIDLALYPVELNRDVRLHDSESWLNSIDLSKLEKLKTWSRTPEDKGDYKPGSETVRLDEKLKPGAYVLEASGGGKSARDLLLVSDATLVLKTSGKQALAWFCNALNGEPLGGARIKLWERWWQDNQYHSRAYEKTAGQDGLALFDLAQRQPNNAELFACAILKERQAFSAGNTYGYSRDSDSWKIYAVTDRPAYRPNETVQWKFIARRYNGSVYSTPADQMILFRIEDPRGALVKEEKIKLNAFGSAWGSLGLTGQMPLGEYRITFYEAGQSWNDSRNRTVGNATLFRLEEYKLPEFKVSVQTPEDHGLKKTFRLGDKVEVNVQADYYFGGPVANANIEILVYQNPFYHYWHFPREYPWFYEDMDSGYSRWNRWYGGSGQIIKRETLKTDAAGKATLTFDTPPNVNQDFDYRIEARVTDSSRREIIGSGNVRVTRQLYCVYADPAHNLYRPQDKVKVEFKALDANEQPVQAEGLVKVTRDYWYETWLNPDGHEVKGQELKRFRALHPLFPPAPEPNQPGWQLKFRGYQHDDILTRSLKTDTNGVAELTFTPEREGYYRVRWASEDRAPKTRPGKRPPPPSPITAETTVWCATGATTDLGYRHGGLEIIADKDTFRAGQNAPIMLAVPANNRYVLFTVEGEDLYNYQVVHLDGAVKLIELPIEEKHVPNVFLSATLVTDRQIFIDSKQVVVPPTRNFLNVDVKADRTQYQPREEGIFTITTRDDSGKPVPSQVAFGLVDESVFYIQQDYAGDPRQFFFGAKRQELVQTQSTMNQKGYTKFVKGPQGQLIDDRELLLEQEALEDAKQGWNRRKDDLALSDELDRSGGGGIGGGALQVKAPGAATRSLAMSGTTADAFKTFNMALPSLPAVAGAAPAQEVPNAQAPVQVRTDFRSTVFWQPDITTDENGTATVKVRYPDSLTSWKATARVASKANQFGIANASTRTKMPLLVRLEAPRFFLVGDTLTLSAVLNNNTDLPIDTKVTLTALGGLKLGHASNETVSVPAHGETRIDWPAEVTHPGNVKLKVIARGGKYSDAMEKSYLVYEHGIEKFIAKSGKARANDITIKFDLPKERRPNSTTLTVQITPRMAVTMLDALPYLIDYPYGCTEQTMSRFLPAAITAKTLKDLGLQPEDIMSRLFGGIEPAHAAATHPNGKKDLAELDKTINASLNRLYDFQHPDGGWGWWKEGESDHWMTAYVVWGLALARDAGIQLKDSPPGSSTDPQTGLPVANGRNALDRGASYLDKTLVDEEENLDMQTWMLHALAAYNHSMRIAQPSKFQANAFDNLWNNRDKLNAYTRALFALAAHNFGKTDNAKILVQNLENGVNRDERPDSSILVSSTPTPAPQHSAIAAVHWGEDGIYWHWSEGGVEATAFALRALLAIDPKNALIEPVTNWLIKNRRAAQWSSTRDTAIVVLALNDYLRESGELKSDVEYELLVNGATIAKKKISGADVFNAPSTFLIDASLIHNANEIRIRRTHGDTPIYFAVAAQFFSLEEPIAPAGNEIFVKRQYFKLVGRPTLLKGYIYEKQPLADGQSVASGERVETVLTIETKNNYQYLLFEDLKPAGLEAVEARTGESLDARQLKSGALEHKFSQSMRVAQATLPGSMPEETDYTGQTRWVHQELRDRKIALFIDKLPQGLWEIRYELRAEVPGRFHALPVIGSAMYVPEIRCNGEELRLLVKDKGGADL